MKKYILVEIEDPKEDSLLRYPSYVAMGTRELLPERCTVRTADLTMYVGERIPDSYHPVISTQELKWS